MDFWGRGKWRENNAPSVEPTVIIIISIIIIIIIMIMIIITVR